MSEIDLSATRILDYYYADAAEIELHGPIVIPSLPKGTPEFTVVGWKNTSDVVPGTPAYQAAQVWGAVATTLNYVMNLKTPPYLKDWSTTYNLVVIPRAGNQLNAYYDRTSLRFFWGKDPQTGTIIYTCDSAGIVCHELGHAILDAMRPDLWNVPVLEFAAFHEAFGDILAIASILQHDIVIEHLLVEITGPDKISNLCQSNIVSRLARQLGHAIYYKSDMIIGADNFLRNAYNDFKYVNPLELSLETGDIRLTQESHNFSRVFTGAWYECFCELFNSNYTNYDLATAIIEVKKACNVMTNALFEAVLLAPSQAQFLQTIAVTMIEVLEKQGKQHETEIAKKVFQNRNLWTEIDHHTILDKALVSTIDIDQSSSGHSMKMNIGATQTTKSQEVEIELPKWAVIQNGDNLHTTLAASVLGFVNYLSVQNLLGDVSENTMFAISDDNKLVRNYICSSFKAMPHYIM